MRYLVKLVPVVSQDGEKTPADQTGKHKQKSSAVCKERDFEMKNWHKMNTEGLRTCNCCRLIRKLMVCMCEKSCKTMATESPEGGMAYPGHLSNSLIFLTVELISLLPVGAASEDGRCLLQYFFI